MMISLKNMQASTCICADEHADATQFCFSAQIKWAIKTGLELAIDVQCVLCMRNSHVCVYGWMCVKHVKAKQLLVVENLWLRCFDKIVKRSWIQQESLLRMANVFETKHTTMAKKCFTRFLLLFTTYFREISFFSDKFPIEREVHTYRQMQL